MDAYSLLRRQAAEKRDRIIKAAHSEYRRAIKEIETLRRGLCGEPSQEETAGSNVSIMGMIRDLMPKDRAFTVTDIADLLRSAHPGHKYRGITLRYFLPRLQQMGIITQVGKANSRILWAAVGAQATEYPHGQMVMIDMAKDILRKDGPMTAIALVEKIQERGYSPTSDPRRLVGWLRRAAKKYEGRISIGENGYCMLVE